jgi:branched-chain amino acid transport system permease protein
MTVMISSSVNLLVVGVLLVLFVVAAPNGILGLIAAMKGRKPRKDSNPVGALLVVPEDRSGRR